MKAAALALALPLCFAAGASAQMPCGTNDLVVTVDPPIALKGQQSFTVTLTNIGSQTWSLSSSCVYTSIHKGDCSGSSVFSPICLTVITPIPPGQSKSMQWDQTDDFGAQVDAGEYGVRIAAFGPSGFVTCCAKATIVECATADAYGSGNPGSGGFVPVMGSAGGLPQLGNGTFQLTVANGRGGAPSLLFAGVAPTSFPAPFGTLLVDLSLPFLQIGFTLGGAPGVAGAGSVALPAPIPNDPSLSGANVYIQTLIVDPGSSGGASHTNGLHLELCG